MIKSFYIKFPQYRWITFRDMRGLTIDEFANAMKDCFLSVWIDETSSYGTFPLESMKCKIPVVGLVPNLIPEWMNEDNGVWVNNKIQMVDYVADFLQNWLEDSINENLESEITKTAEDQGGQEDEGDHDGLLHRCEDRGADRKEGGLDHERWPRGAPAGYGCHRRLSGKPRGDDRR
jgi:hypothetical protein